MIDWLNVYESRESMSRENAQAWLDLSLTEQHAIRASIVNAGKDGIGSNDINRRLGLTAKNLTMTARKVLGMSQSRAGRKRAVPTGEATSVALDSGFASIAALHTMSFENLEKYETRVRDTFNAHLKRIEDAKRAKRREEVERLKMEHAAITAKIKALETP